MRWRTPSVRSALIGPTLVAAGAVHVAPGVALLFPDRMAGLYGVEGLGSNEVVLLRHRALLLAVLGAALLGAVAAPGLRRPALIATLASNAVFVGLVATADTSPEIVRVAVVDGALLPLVVAALMVDSRDRGPAATAR